MLANRVHRVKLHLFSQTLETSVEMGFKFSFLTEYGRRKSLANCEIKSSLPVSVNLLALRFAKMQYGSPGVVVSSNWSFRDTAS